MQAYSRFLAWKLLFNIGNGFHHHRQGILRSHISAVNDPCLFCVCSDSVYTKVCTAVQALRYRYCLCAFGYNRSEQPLLPFRAFLPLRSNVWQNPWYRPHTAFLSYPGWMTDAYQAMPPFRPLYKASCHNYTCRDFHCQGKLRCRLQISPRFRLLNRKRHQKSYQSLCSHVPFMILTRQKLTNNISCWSFIRKPWKRRQKFSGASLCLSKNGRWEPVSTTGIGRFPEHDWQYGGGICHCVRTMGYDYPVIFPDIFVDRVADALMVGCRYIATVNVHQRKRRDFIFLNYLWHKRQYLYCLLLAWTRRKSAFCACARKCSARLYP